jgi:Uma2 family endonuclease
MAVIAASKPSATEQKIYTVEEYFELEEHSEIRHEFYYGKLIPMAGESRIANQIADNCGYALRTNLRQKGYYIYRHDVRTFVREGKIYRYPDVVVTSKADNENTHALLSPELMIEVTSENSEKTDREVKLKEYIAMPSVLAYVIISQTERCVEVYSRDEKGWRYDILAQAKDVLNVQLNHAICTLALQDIYDEIDFEEGAKPDTPLYNK